MRKLNFNEKHYLLLNIIYMFKKTQFYDQIFVSKYFIEILILQKTIRKEHLIMETQYLNLVLWVIQISAVIFFNREEKVPRKGVFKNRPTYIKI